MPTPAFNTKTLAFLRRLSRNNDREWFHARRDEYEAYVRGPMLAFVERLAVDFRAFAPELQADPKISMFRPWRDTRFSENKAPLKTNIAAVFPDRRLGRMNGAGLYFEVAPTYVWIGGGIYAPDGPQLQAIREHIAANYKALDAIVGSREFKTIGGLSGERTSRVPRGFARDHPASHYLQHKQLLGAREEPAAFATRPDFYRQLLGTFRAIVPLCMFINEPLVDRLKFDRRPHVH
jgi:uncharacterized protein (TIGR02453 family)